MNIYEDFIVSVLTGVGSMINHPDDKYKNAFGDIRILNYLWISHSSFVSVIMDEYTMLMKNIQL